MKLPKAITETIQNIKNTRYELQRISRLVNDPKLSSSYFPETERKSKTEIWKDHLLCLAKYNEVNHYYYVYGLDRKGADASELLPYRTFRIIRNRTNLHPNKDGYNYACLLRDKFVFGQFLTSLQFPTPKNIALFNQGEITWLETMKAAPLASLAENKNYDGFCKQLAGTMGKGAFALRLSEGRFYIEDKEITLEQLRERLNGQYLLQERVIQHSKMATLHPSSVNTMRVMTFNNNGIVSVFSAALRIGTQGSSIDNWSSGGILIRINLQTGQLQGQGFYKPGYGGCVKQHPNSGIVLDGFEIPFFQESLDMLCKLHQYFYGVHSIGWDVAITPEGPVLVEGNDDWDGAVPMALEKNFKTRFLRMFPNNSADTDLPDAKTMRVEAG
jgi:hypothetical protein